MLMCAQFSQLSHFNIKHISFPTNFEPHGNLISKLHLSEIDEHLFNAKLVMDGLDRLMYQQYNLLKCIGVQGSNMGL